jgi:tryptophan 2,3-dioxygenase
MADDLHKPVLPGHAPSDYERYLRTDELLALQKTPAEVVHHDEHLFHAVHQSSELWLKLAATEIEEATTLVAGDAVVAAVRLIRRANDCMDLITAQLHMLDHLSPIDYAVVRTALGHGAGFDSPGFRRLHRVSPALGDAFGALLERRGVDLIGVYRAGHAQEDLY